MSALLTGRGFSTLWAPMLQLFFPVKFFGIIFGVVNCLSIPLNLISIPMFAFIDDTYDFSVVNYIFTGMTIIVMTLPSGTSCNTRYALRLTFFSLHTIIFRSERRVTTLSADKSYDDLQMETQKRNRSRCSRKCERHTGQNHRRVDDIQNVHRTLYEEL